MRLQEFIDALTRELDLHGDLTVAVKDQGHTESLGIIVGLRAEKHRPGRPKLIIESIDEDYAEEMDRLQDENLELEKRIEKLEEALAEYEDKD